MLGDEYWVLTMVTPWHWTLKTLLTVAMSTLFLAGVFQIYKASLRNAWLDRVTASQLQHLCASVKSQV